MFYIRKIIATSGVALALLGTGIGIAAAEQASSNSPQACYIRTDIPDWENDARVGREGCANTLSGTGRIKENRPNFPDDVVGELTFQAGVRWVFGSCGNGPGYYYSEFSSSSGAFGQSADGYRC